MTERNIFVAHPSRMLTDNLPHGDGLAAFNFISRLAQRGHRLHVVVENAELREPLPDTVTLHRVPPRRRGHGGDQVRLAYQIRRELQRARTTEHIDVVHQLNPVDTGLTSLLPRNSPPIVLGPYVPAWPRPHAIAGQPPSALQRARHALEGTTRDALLWHTQRVASALLLSTQAARSKVRSSRPRVRELSYGVDAGFFSPGERTSGHEPRVLFLANLQARKGILVLLEAFERVAGNVPGARLVVAGDGPEEDEVERIVAASPHRDRIELRGRLDRAAAADAMRAADVYCLPSFSEPFGISALEAMACGMPVVGTNVGGLAHLVHEEGGRTVPPGDRAALAAALTELLSAEDLRRRMGEFNRALVERRYSWDAVIDELEDVYDEATALAA